MPVILGFIKEKEEAEVDGSVLQTRGLTKSYAHTKALNNVTLTINKGGIYGFVGQNGAGKTTFMRVVSGLSLPDCGEMTLFGVTGKKKLEKQRKRMGCMIEAPALYAYMTAWDHLEAIRIAKGIPNRDRVEQCLQIAGLTYSGRKKVRNFSMGMKQRLGIASALLGEPEFLMLDEPTNGLDPVSITEIRELLKQLVRERQLTILLSSHILGELYQLATDYIFLHQGRVVQILTKEQLDERCKKHIFIQTEHAAEAVIVLERSLHTQNYVVLPDHSIRLYDHTDDIQKVITAFAGNGLVIKNIGIAGDSLEHYFIDTIGGNQNA